jgi:hypothetical protein
LSLSSHDARSSREKDVTEMEERRRRIEELA